MRLIDADKALEHIKKRLLETALNNSRVVCDASYLYADISDNRIETWINEAPTVDAVPVVRCKDCVNWDTSWKPQNVIEGEYWCSRCDIYSEADDYCSKAERIKG